MNTRTFLATLALMLAAPVYAAGEHDHAHEHKPLHGGVVVEAKDMDYELVAQPDRIRLYLRDHGKAVDVAKASAKLTLLSGAEKQEVELKPAGDRLEARGAFKVSAGSKVVVLVTSPGKPAANVRFVLK